MELKRYSGNPIIVPDENRDYEKDDTYNPCTVLYKGKINMIYRAEDKYGDYISTLCLATSKDGYHFKEYSKNPVIKPTRPEEKRGCEDPRIVKIGDTFYLTYTAYKCKRGGKHKIGLSLATSKDLIRWKKHGVIIDKVKAGQILPDKINDEYIMFLGEGDISIARSKNLLNWKIDKQPLIRPRSNNFDSKLVEVGPPPIVVGDKLVLFYNSADHKIHYRVGFVVLDRKNPAKIIYRCQDPVLVPQEQFELYGKVNNVVFMEGLVEYKGKYFLYYGGADKCVGVATLSKKSLKDTLSKIE